MELSPFFGDDDYQLNNDESPITLDLKFGSLGQSPDFDLDLDDRSLLSHGKRSIRNFPLGKSSDLDGRVLLISGNIADMPETDDQLTLDLRVKGGPAPLIGAYAVKATTGDHVALSIKVRFHKIMILALITLTTMLHGYAQQAQKINLLRAPASPVAQILNFASTAIERPTDLTDLWLSVKNATNNLTKLPNSYALDLSPANLFKSNYLALSSLNSNKFKEVIAQSFVVSTGFKQFEDSVTHAAYFKMGIGFKVSLIRPGWSETTLKQYDTLSGIQEKLTTVIKDARNAAGNDPAVLLLLVKREDARKQFGEDSPEFAEAKKQHVAAELNKFNELVVEKQADLGDQLKKTASVFSIERIGWSLDLAGGFSASFPNNELNYSIADKAGLWLTGGYNGGNNALTILAITRYLYQPEKIFADPTGKISTRKIHTLDGGLSLIYNTKDGKFNASTEFIYRSVLNKSIVDPSWRVIANLAYNVGVNEQLSLNFGRDFDGAVETGGNLIAGINFVLGLGGLKAIK